mmetsp:Transcript_5715/g.22537  ORF Transcript_5715/g.22537 Transcript_5715/m.22537 type:complete len:256 (-) Transcript_5715:13-780(-)
MNARTARPDASAADGSGEYTPPSLNRKNTAFGGIAVPLGTRFPSRTNRVRSIAARHINTSLVVSPPASPSRVVRKPSPRRHRAPLARALPAFAVSPPLAPSRPSARAPYTHSSNFVPSRVPRRSDARPSSIATSQSGFNPRSPRAVSLANASRAANRSPSSSPSSSTHTSPYGVGAYTAPRARCGRSVQYVPSGATSRANPSPSRFANRSPFALGTRRFRAATPRTCLSATRGAYHASSSPPARIQRRMPTHGTR